MPFPDTILAPMEAKSVDRLPDEDGWQFEPKWDGFRCIAFIRSGNVQLQSKSGKPLARFFPEVAATLAHLPDVVLDGELLIPIGPALSFDALQARLHPAESRIRRLSVETPARYMLFDCLWADGEALTDRPLVERRAALEAFHAHYRSPMLRLSPATADVAKAQAWLDAAGGALDGGVTKRLDEPYQPGMRTMRKVKRLRTADCVVGGVRYGTDSRQVAAVLLGLYGDAGLVHHVGFTSGLAAIDKPALTAQFEALIEAPGFTGDAPGGPSRWSTDRSAEWQPLRPQLVAEVRYDHVTARRFRHGTGFLRWRPDKAPAQCTMDQLGDEASPAVVEAALRNA